MNDLLASKTEIANCGLSPDEEIESSVESFSIPAEAHADDYVVQIKFDAVDYIQTATVETLQELIDCDWGGDYPSDYVANHYEEGVLKPLFDYIELIRDTRSRKEACGFECHVDGSKAEIWLEANRPEVFNQLQF